MSKRFGRNQKRKLRKAVKEANARADMEGGLRQHIYKKYLQVKDDRDRMIKAIEQISPYSVCIKPKDIRMANQQDVIYLDTIENPYRDVYKPEDMPMQVQFSRQKLHQIEVGVYTDGLKHVLEQCLHAKVTVKGTNLGAAYYMTWDAIERTGVPVQMIAEALSISIKESDREKREISK